MGGSSREKRGMSNCKTLLFNQDGNSVIFHKKRGFAGSGVAAALTLQRIIERDHSSMKSLLASEGEYRHGKNPSAETDLSKKREKDRREGTYRVLNVRPHGVQEGLVSTVKQEALRPTIS